MLSDSFQNMWQNSIDNDNWARILRKAKSLGESMEIFQDIYIREYDTFMKKVNEEVDLLKNACK